MQKVNIITLDDLDGSEGASTVSFSFEGVQYEVDLGEKNTEKFRKAISPYIDVARRVGGRRGSSSKSSGGSDAKLVRAWAAEQGIEVPERGRIPADVREKYDAAH